MDLLQSRLTPFNDSYPTCERTEATLGIYNVEPSIVTKKLGVEPTREQTKGIPREPPYGNRVLPRINSWLLSSEDHVSSKDLRRHLDWLLDQVEPSSAQLKELQSFPEARMAILCTWWSALGDGGPTLWPEQMKRIANLNLELSIAFSYYGDGNDK